MGKKVPSKAVKEWCCLNSAATATEAVCFLLKGMSAKALVFGFASPYKRVSDAEHK